MVKTVYRREDKTGTRYKRKDTKKGNSTDKRTVTGVRRG
jgi:hypothetical protein